MRSSRITYKHAWVYVHLMNDGSYFYGRPKVFTECPIEPPKDAVYRIKVSCLNRKGYSITTWRKLHWHIR